MTTLFLTLSFSLVSLEEPQQPADLFISSPKSMETTEGKLKYVMEAGKERLFDHEGKEKVEIFFVAYFKQEAEDDRPLTFCFNGGPGSSAIWLHMGAFGPKRVEVKMEGGLTPPFETEDNPYTLLDYTDLVFVDPVSTGFSKAVKGEDPKQYYGVDEDIKLMSEFVRLYVTKKGRWNTPKYLAGESYGTARVIGMADYLFEKHRMSFNGLILISTATNLSWLRGAQPGHDLPYVFFLPSYTAAAHYHKRLPAKSRETVEEAIARSRSYAEGPYLLALMQGDQLPDNEKKQVADQLSLLTGISSDWIFSSNIRIDPLSFCEQLLRAEGKVIGRFDSRFSSGALEPHAETMDYDPSQDSIFIPYVAALNQYLRQEIGWDRGDEYRYLVNTSPWNYCRAGNVQMNMGSSLREILIRIPDFKVYSALGIYDMATPLLSQEYIFQHLNLSETQKKNIKQSHFPAGHMMYTDVSSLSRMKQELKPFFSRRK
ncbi:S10 family peptidase [Estrella lausannensis]|nr:peptidase S10 [Estrella lausannensis]